MISAAALGDDVDLVSAADLCGVFAQNALWMSADFCECSSLGYRNSIRPLAGYREMVLQYCDQRLSFCAAICTQNAGLGLELQDLIRLLAPSLERAMREETSGRRLDGL